MDILIFAAIAFFIFLKLNKQLGQVNDEERKSIQDKIKKKREELMAAQGRVMKKVKATVENINKADAKILANLDEQTKQNFLKILQRCDISAEFFVNGAKSAFEMTIKAFSGGDLYSLKMLVSDKIYQGFESAINYRKETGHILTTNVIAVESADIVSAIALGDSASVVMKIHSKQINYVSDPDGNIIEGSKEEIGELNDIWTFKKDLSSPNPNWTVYTTSSS